MNQASSAKRSKRGSIHRVLFVRLLVTAVVIALGLGLLVAWVEYHRMQEFVSDRAVLASARIHDLIQSELDAPGLGDHGRIQEALDQLVANRLPPAEGHFILVRILDLDLREVARLEDRQFPELAAASRVAEADLASRPVIRDREKSVGRIGSQQVVRLRGALSNSAGVPVAYVQGVFAVSPLFRQRALRDMAVSSAAAMGIVLLTTALLYPVILRLLGRVHDLSARLLQANLEIMKVLGSAIAQRDSDTDLHNYRVTIYSARIGQAMGLDANEMRALIKGAFLHDVGKIGVPDGILRKPGRLTEEEYGEMKTHVQRGLDIVSRSTWLEDAAAVVGCHHEKYDGSGYDRRLRAVDIPRVASVFAVADVFDALTSRRPYKEPLGFDESIAVLQEGRGTHFHPAVLDAFQGVARPLYEEYARRDDGPGLAHEVMAIAKPYFVVEL